ncbi:MAG: nicotinate-nucleotide adenylyltransferase [Prevotella sp.]|nr:nicotinate-nucleotide adenylyltransferase [Prevotella sp.]
MTAQTLSHTAVETPANRACGAGVQSPEPLRTGVFGGSFNPIHNGHIALARQLLRQAALHEIWFVVSPLNPFKREATDLLADDLRLDLTRRALSREPHLMASDCEFGLPRPSYMWNTLQHLAAQHPDRRFVLIIGADNWLSFDRWAHADDILQHHEVVVYPREGFPIVEADMPPQVRLMHTALYPLSSTDIRRRVRDGESIDGMVPEEIRSLVQTYYRV